MSALALRLLLILSLVFNAVAAPWAMARMQHDGHAHGVDAASPQDTRQHAAGHDHATMSHASPHDHAAMLHAAAHDHAPTLPDQAAAHDDSACCDGAMCQCGCILPPAVAFFATLVLDPQPSLQIDIPHAALAVVARSSPPFRPPAV